MLERLCSAQIFPSRKFAFYYEPRETFQKAYTQQYLIKFLSLISLTSEDIFYCGTFFIVDVSYKFIVMW